MTCSNCGAQNAIGSTFCIQCGTNLTEVRQSNNLNTTPIQSEQLIQQVQQSSYNQLQSDYQKPVNSTKVSTSSLNYLMYIIAILMRPIKCFKEEEAKLNDSKISFLLALIITGAMTVMKMVKTILTTVRVVSYNWSDGYTYSWEWDNLKDIKWLEVIGKNFLIYACIIFAIAVVFYLGSLVIKKQLSFIKSLSIASTSVIPAFVGMMILSLFGGMIWSPLSIVFSIVGGVYSLIVLYELVNSELQLEDDVKIYFNLVCFGILSVVGCFAFMKLFISSVSSGLDNLLEVFQ